MPAHRRAIQARPKNSNNGDNSSAGGNNGGSVVEAPSNGDTLKWLGYYDLNKDDKEIVDKFNDAGYKVETISTSSAEYFYKAGTACCFFRLSRYGTL